MAKLILPHTIDAGTDITAVELQDNFIATRDTMNGLLQGGDPATVGNMLANGITYRELSHNLMKYHTRGPIKQEGVFAEGEMKVSPSSGLILAVAAGEAMITDDTAVVFDVGMKVPVKYAGGTITLDAAHGTLPRVDQIVARVTDYEVVAIEKLTGTATAGAQITTTTGASYRAGAAALGNDRIRLADVLVPATDTVISADQINDRRPWCRGEMEFSFTTQATPVLRIYSDLDGLVDGGYEFALNAHLVQAGVSRNIGFRFNGDTVSNYHSELIYNDAGGAPAGANYGYHADAHVKLTSTPGTVDTIVGMSGTIYTAPPITREKLVVSDGYQIETGLTQRRRLVFHSWWNNVVDNLQAIELNLSGGTLTGKFTIRKLQTAI